MDNVHVKKKYGGIAMVAVLVFGAVTAGLIVAPQTAYAAVTIQTSQTTMFGPGFVRVLVTDTSFDSSGDTIIPQIEVRRGSSTIVSDSVTVESIGSSGTFEFFITTSNQPLVPENPTKKTVPTGSPYTAGPFIVRIFDDADDAIDAAGVTGATAVTVNRNAAQVPDTIFTQSNDKLIDLEAPNDVIKDGDVIRIIYGGQTADVRFEDVKSTITADRTVAGTDNDIVLSLADSDANLDPTVVDTFVFVTPTNLLTSTNAITYGDAVWRETGQNSGVFEQTITVGTSGTNDLNPTLPTGNTFTAIDHSVYENLDTVTSDTVLTSATFTGPIQVTGTSSVSATLRNSDGQLSILEDPTLTNGLMLSITDADRNKNTETQDTITTQVAFTVDLDGDGILTGGETSTAFTFEETGDNTGIFVPKYDRDTVGITLTAGTGAFDGVAGRITLDFVDIPGAGEERELISDDEFTVTYNDPAAQNNAVSTVKRTLQTTEGEISTEMESASVNEDVEVTVTDPDLNTNPETIETYDASGGHFMIGTASAGRLEIEAGTVADVLSVAGNTVDATFIETGPDTGVFTASDIDMSDIDAAADNNPGNGGGTLKDGNDVTFTYVDEMEDPDEDTDVSIQVGLPDVGIDVDRKTVPIPLTGLDPVVIVLTVVDPNANANSNSIEDTVAADLTVQVRDGDGTVVNTANFGGAELAGAIQLTETGPNTGIFEEDIDLLAGGAITRDQLRDTQVVFTYNNGDSDDSVTVTYRSYDGAITVSPAVISTGGEFDVQVIDQDLNRDPDTTEEVNVACETDENTEQAGECPITLTETGDNTGIFTETVRAGDDITVADLVNDDFTTEILFTYTDVVTSSGEANEAREATVRVATATGQLTVEPEIVGPRTEVTLTLSDTDLNDDPDSTDNLAAGTVELSSSDGADADIAFEETGPNTGVFEATITFEPRAANAQGAVTSGANSDDVGYSALPGDIIAFRYEDEEAAGGGSRVVSVTLEITSQDPTMESASPTVQIGGTIDLTVEDADANRDADAVDSVDVDVTSDSDPVGFTLSALETGENTGIFTLQIPTNEGLVSGSITVAAGDDVFLEYNDAFPADYADRVDVTLNPDKDFVLVVPVGTSVSTDTSATTPEPVVPMDISGNELDEVGVGQQVVLATTVNNNRNTDLQYAAVIEVRDADGFTVSLQWAAGTLPAGGENEVGLSWTPMEAGTYTIRTFVLSDIANPSALSLIEESTLTVS